MTCNACNNDVLETDKTCPHCGAWLVDPVMAMMDLTLDQAEFNDALQTLKIGLEKLSTARFRIVGSEELGSLSVWQVAAASPAVASLMDAATGLVAALGGEVQPGRREGPAQ